MKHKHHQVVDFNNPNEGQFTSASTSEITVNKMSKQTAVEWLWEQIDNSIPFQNIQTSQIFNGLLEQAKAIEKEQIEQAFADGVDDEYEWHINNQPRSNAEQYYKQTFKQ